MSKNKLVEDALIEYGMNLGDRIMCRIIDDHPQLDDSDIRQETVIFSLFVYCCQYLYMNGWTERQLMREVNDHCEIIDKKAEDKEE